MTGGVGSIKKTHGRQFTDLCFQFGGDKDHVVIHGASAGAGSVVLHMTAYGGRNDGLFVGGVAESVFFPAQPYMDELEWQFSRVAQQTACNETDDIMACLRSKDVETLQLANAVQPFPNRTAPPYPLFYWTPCIDGELIEDLPYTMWQNGKYLDLPIVFGDDTNEGTVFAMNATTQQDFTDFMQDNYPLLTDADTAAILDRYPKLPPVPDHGSWFPTLSEAYGEATFTCPAINMLTMFANRNRKSNDSSSTATGTGYNSSQAAAAWSYRYDVQDADLLAAGMGTPHLFEAAAIFGSDNIQGAAASYYTYNAPIVPVVMDYWISFVRSLDPNAHRDGQAPVWEPWSSGGAGGGGTGGQRLLMRTGNLTMETIPADQMARCQFWLGLAQTLEQKK
jgi:acetylcholinesterase